MGDTIHCRNILYVLFKKHSIEMFCRTWGLKCIAYWGHARILPQWERIGYFGAFSHIKIFWPTPRNPSDMHLWEHMNLGGFFKLATWGSNYLKVYQAFSTMVNAYDCTIIGFQGHQAQLHINRPMMWEALNLPHGKSIGFFKVIHSQENND